MHKKEEILEAKNYIIKKGSVSPEIGIVLGSGLGDLADEITDQITIPYEEIPFFKKSDAIGHDNKLILGNLEGKSIVAMKGRYHYYEGYSLDEVTFPIRVMKELGIEKLIVTNASGAVNKEFDPGDLMLITDHLNLVGSSPLIGENNEELGPRFPDSSEIYNKDLRQIAVKVANEQNITLRKGVYTWWSGPLFETPAEIKMIRTLGGDATGMSTVPEAIVAQHSDLKILGISCITNMGSGILDQPLNHEDVIDVAGKAKSKFMHLIKEILKEI